MQPTFSAGVERSEAGIKAQRLMEFEFREISLLDSRVSDLERSERQKIPKRAVQNRLGV